MTTEVGRAVLAQGPGPNQPTACIRQGVRATQEEVAWGSAQRGKAACVAGGLVLDVERWMRRDGLKYWRGRACCLVQQQQGPHTYFGPYSSDALMHCTTTCSASPTEREPPRYPPFGSFPISTSRTYATPASSFLLLLSLVVGYVQSYPPTIRYPSLRESR